MFEELVELNASSACFKHSQQPRFGVGVAVVLEELLGNPVVSLRFTRLLIAAKAYAFQKAKLHPGTTTLSTHDHRRYFHTEVLKEQKLNPLPPWKHALQPPLLPSLWDRLVCMHVLAQLVVKLRGLLS